MAGARGAALPMRRAVCLLAVLAWLLAGLGGAQAREIVVFAAASLKEVLDEAALAFGADTGTRIVAVYAGSAALARQIQQGAPADVFLSANPQWLDLLIDQALVPDDSRVIVAGNRLVVVGADRADVMPGDPRDVLGQLRPGDRLSMGLVAAVPAGLYGKAALDALGLWSGVAPHVVQTDNVRAALRLVALGEARMGIVYATDVGRDDAVAVLARFPEASHPPIRYVGGLVGRNPPAQAGAFLDYLTGPAGQALFAGRGFQTGLTE